MISQQNNEKNESSTRTASCKIDLELPKEAELLVCDVCGHANQKGSALCTMCSNYLFESNGGTKNGK